MVDFNISCPSVRVLLCFTLIVLSQCDKMTLHKHDISTGARCLDGSQAPIYFIEGSQSDKTLIFFQGGGRCDGPTLSQAIHNCYNRSFTALGSSKFDPPTIDPDLVSLTSSNSTVNPLYHDWNRVIIPYCDGNLHQGYTSKPISYRGRDIYFRGTNNTQTHFDWINEKFGLYKAKQVVLTGISAGGIAVFFWGNYLYHRLENKDGLLLLPDSGLFLNIFENERTDIESASSINKITNVEIKMPIEECVKDHPDQEFCFKTYAIRDYIIAPLFIIESLYDEYALSHFYNLTCISTKQSPANMESCTSDQKEIAQRYYKKSLEVLTHFTEKNSNGAWGISCIYHGLTDGTVKYQSQKVAVYEGSEVKKTIHEALSDFVEKKSRTNLDSVAYPNNVGCNGIKTFSNLQFQ